MNERMFTIKATDLDVQLLVNVMRFNPVPTRDNPEGSMLERKLIKQSKVSSKSERSETTFEVNKTQAKVLEELLLPLETSTTTERGMHLMLILDQVRGILYNASRQ